MSFWRHWLAGLVEACVTARLEEFRRRHEAEDAQIVAKLRDDILSLRSELRQLRAAYVERYDAEEGAGWPARFQRLEAAKDGLPEQFAQLAERVAAMEASSSAAASSARRQFERLARSNPMLPPYPL